MNCNHKYIERNFIIYIDINNYLFNIHMEQIIQQRRGGMFRLLQQSEIQPDRKPNKNFSRKFWNNFDIFTYIPTPQSYPVSTKRSRCGSCLIFILFFAYFGYVFFEFLTNNTPKLNSFQVPLQQRNFTVPQMAIGFIYGLDLNNTLNDPTQFTINTIQVSAPVGQKDTQTNLTINTCDNALPWLGGTNGIQNYYQNLTCLYPNNISWAGLLYASNMTYYPRFTVTLCNFTATPTFCGTNASFYNTTAGGRLFLFIKRDQNINFADTKKSQTAQANQFGTFYMYNYFLIPFVYSRVILTFQPTTYRIYPDYFTSWRTSEENQTVLVDQQLQVSNVSANNPLPMFSISIVLSSQQQIHEVVYQTLLDLVSLAGAMWSVLFGLFAVLCLAYNKRKFFEQKPDWKEFEEKVELIQNKLNINESKQRETTPVL